MATSLNYVANHGVIVPLLRKLVSRRSHFFLYDFVLQDESHTYCTRRRRTMTLNTISNFIFVKCVFVLLLLLIDYTEMTIFNIE